ncbi:DUF6221 family protein [Nonomuraea sp. NPDC050786]|uniref:DUF6221 family protein n=1 Tax=Nonomuraea sp. NPDC050786 TaxID=3154840 RepID=UPI0033ED7DB7
MEELVDFLRDRLDEEEIDAGRAMDELVMVATFRPGMRVQMPVDVALHQVPPAVRSHIARWDPPRVRDEVAWRRAFLDRYETTVRLRDEAAARIRAAGHRPDGGDLTRWERAHDEVAVMEPIVREMAAPYYRLPGFRPEWRTS